MTTTKVQPPRKLTDEEDLDSFEDWWFQAECYYSRDQKFSEFFDDENKTWGSRSDENRNLESAEEATNLNTLLRALATYSSGPYVKKELLDETRSLKDVRQVFLRYLEIDVTDHSLLNYYSLTRRPNERPLVFYHRLRYHILQHHLPSGTVLNPNKTLAADEVISATMERFIIMEWLNRLDNRLIKFIQEKFATELSASSTCLLTMVDSLAKNVDKYITQLDMASVNLLPSQANFQSPSMHSGSAEQEIGGVMLNRGGYNRGYNRQASSRRSGVQRGGNSSFSRRVPYSDQKAKCEYCFMQSKGRGQNLDYFHAISNCPQMIAKFSRINLATAGDEESDTESENNKDQEYADFYGESL